MPRPISRSELARIAGVSPAAITKATRGKLAPACTGDRIDLDHPAVAEYLGGRGIKVPAAVAARKPDRAPTKSPKPAAKRKPAPTEPRPTPPKQVAKNSNARRPSSPQSIEMTEEFEDYSEFTLRQIVDQFGTGRQFKDYLDALKKIEDTRGKRLENDETEGELISRELVRAHVMGTINAAFVRLLRDVPQTVARRLYAAARSDVPIEEGEKLTRDTIESVLGPIKDAVGRTLKAGDRK